jgi:hypothetical protein
MKRLLFFLALPAGIVAMDACSENVQEAKNAYGAISNLETIAQNVEQSTALAAKKREERIKRGDTLALNYKELQSFLPADIAGYSTSDDPTGSTMSMPGMSYSVSEQRYSHDDDYVKVNIMDYNGAYGLYAGAIAVYGSGFSMEDENEKMQGIELGITDVKGWEVIRKKEKKATVLLGIGERFFVTVEANNQENTDLVKSVVRQMALEKLAKL